MTGTTAQSDDTYNMQFKPLRALKATVKFIENKEDTSQVFRILASLDGGQSEKNFQRFRQSDTGSRILAEQRSLFEFLCDRDAISQMPEGSFGRAYLDFITSEGLSPEGFQQEIERADEQLSEITGDRGLNRMRIRHAHDLWHVITGYGRDMIGEAALLGFTYAQTRIPGFAYLGTITALKAKSDFGGLPVLACFREGYEVGKKAEWLMEADWENLFALPLEEVRVRLNVVRPEAYLAIADKAANRDAELRAALAGDAIAA